MYCDIEDAILLKESSQLGIMPEVRGSLVFQDKRDARAGESPREPDHDSQDLISLLHSQELLSRQIW